MSKANLCYVLERGGDATCNYCTPHHLAHIRTPRSSQDAVVLEITCRENGL